MEWEKGKDSLHSKERFMKVNLKKTILSMAKLLMKMNLFIRDKSINMKKEYSSIQMDQFVKKGNLWMISFKVLEVFNMKIIN